MLIKVIRDVYKTYQDDSGIHKTRLICSILMSILISALAIDIEKSTFQIASLVITVLTGFTFTALFSNYSVTMAGLPDPSDENDIFDLNRLKILGHNFAIRSKLFIILALIDLTVIMFISTKLEMPISGAILAKTYLQKLHISVADVEYSADIINVVFFSTLKALTIFVFLECIYTFYRLAETILAVIEIRKAYIETKIFIDPTD